MRMEWIPVSERLPEEEGTYLVTDDSGGVAWTQVSFFIPQEGEMKEPFWEYINVTAWMPLPKPYKGEDDE